MNADGVDPNGEIPLRIVTSETTVDSLSDELSKSLDPATLDPHRVTVEVEVGSSEIMLYGLGAISSCVFSLMACL